jgi:hypothetical protein
MLKPEEIRVDTGRCVGGTFIRVVHVPTGISKEQAPIGGRSGGEVVRQFSREIESELVARGLTQYIVPDAH